MSNNEDKPGIGVLVIAMLLVTGQTSAVDFNNILHQYTLICGQSHLCGRTTFAEDLDPPSIYHGPIFCPRCKCDSNCFERGNCCPDLLFPHPGLACLNLTVFHSKNVRNHALAHTECPAATPETLAKRCSGDYTIMEKFTMTPVSSNNSLVVYRNKFCAECFGEENTVPWSLNIDCQGMIDLNHVTSYDALLGMIEENSCSMTYQSPNHQRYVSCDIPRNLKDFRKIEECNITGAWATYDPDIEWACQRIDQPYKYYKNIFCYMCNPGKYRRKSQIIDQCNQTAVWSVFDKNLRDVCDLAPSVPESYPFKNVFCYQCNRNTSNDDIFLDASIDIESEEISTFGFRITSFNNLKVQTAGKATMISTRNTSSWYDTAVPEEGMAVDIQKLLFMHFLHYGHQLYCDKTLSFKDARDTNVDNLPECGCDITCVQTSDCCTDFAMTSPITVPKHIPGFVVSKCYNVTDTPYLLNSCQDGGTDASFAHVPITSSQSGIMYRNVYCFLCNEGRALLPSTNFAGDVHISLSQEMYEALDLKLECDFLIKYEEFYLLSELIKNVEHKVQNHGNAICTIRFPTYGIGNRLQVSTVSICNITGQWDVYDADIKWACENYIPDITFFFQDGITEYRNIFCKICNSNSTSKITIDTCSVKGHVAPINVTMASRCEMYPTAPSMVVYKNKFCAECYPQEKAKHLVPTVIFTKKDDCIDKSVVEFTPMLTSTYRKMFTFKALADNAVSDDAKNSNMSGRCQQDEVFDSKKVVCRPLHCFEGKYLAGNACRPFLPYATLLGYTMAMNVVVNFTPKNNDTIGEVMGPLQNVIKDLVSTNLKIRPEYIEFVSMYMLVHQSCGSSLDPTRQQFLLHTSFVIESMVDRLATENQLVTMTSSNFSVPCMGIVCNVKFAYDKGALELPTTTHTTELDDSCFLVSHRQFSYTSERYKLKYVSKFLTCQHVEIDEDQYKSYGHNFYIDLLPSGPRLNFGEFRKTGSSKRIQICFEDFETMMASLIGKNEDSIEDTVKFVLQVISFVCVCLSVLGLLITFLTYCFFSSLRTLPGKNNMCLIASLFLSQFLMQLGISQPKDRTLCATFGLMIHYFWLVTFFSMNVCSYHMFRVFVFPLNQIKNKKSEYSTHLRYLCYCLGLPALIIAMYVGISVSEEGNIGYGSDVKCFISSLPAFIATFIAPVFVICLANIVFYSVTVYHIAKVPHVSSNKSSRREVSVHIKLFLLTGISWIFQLIDSFVPVSAFSIIVNFVNASQGIFIFIAYCVNRRVRSFYKDSLSFRTSSSVITSSSGRRISRKEASTDNQI
ncbi:uncharacterized protein LOC117335889 [Pecten maximus]|uniref:uncharacterized protein LOC117335889 n=1 Tax=Pecten maximus TaxID=6579 RepID=UPI001458373C|nr:uncharacterized protein LOC117335889 [Pecten maximus]